MGEEERRRKTKKIFGRGKHLVQGGEEEWRWRKMFEKGKYWSTEVKKNKEGKGEKYLKRGKNGPQWRRRTEKEKEEIILRRKFNGEANQPTG